jgi:hypothetical protein
VWRAYTAASPHASSSALLPPSVLSRRCAHLAGPNVYILGKYTLRGSIKDAPDACGLCHAVVSAAGRRPSQRAGRGGHSPLFVVSTQPHTPHARPGDPARISKAVQRTIDAYSACGPIACRDSHSFPDTASRRPALGALPLPTRTRRTMYRNSGLPERERSNSLDSLDGLTSFARCVHAAMHVRRALTPGTDSALTTHDEDEDDDGEADARLWRENALGSGIFGPVASGSGTSHDHDHDHTPPEASAPAGGVYFTDVVPPRLPRAVARELDDEPSSFDHADARPAPSPLIMGRFGLPVSDPDMDMDTDTDTELPISDVSTNGPLAGRPLLVPSSSYVAFVPSPTTPTATAPGPSSGAPPSLFPFTRRGPRASHSPIRRAASWTVPAPPSAFPPRVSGVASPLGSGATTPVEGVLPFGRAADPALRVSRSTHASPARRPPTVRRTTSVVRAAPDHDDDPGARTPRKKRRVGADAERGRPAQAVLIL